VNLANTLKCFLISLLLLIGHTSVFNTADIKLSLSLLSSPHSYNKWSIVWSVVPQGQIGVSIILNRCKYDLMLPCPATMHVTFWVMFNFIFSLSATTGKYYVVTFPLLFGPIPFATFERNNVGRGLLPPGSPCRESTRFLLKLQHCMVAKCRF
jgi:hypothetical protein